MPRDPLPVGTHGAVNTRAQVNGKWYPKATVPDGPKPTVWEASTRYRFSDGSTGPVKRRGASETKAKAAVEQACKDLSGKARSKLPAGSRFNTVAALWIGKVQNEEKGSTYDTYRRWLNSVVLPALGELRVRECNPPRLQDFFDGLNGYSPNTRRNIRKVVAGVLQYSVVPGGILATNPIRELNRIKGGTLSRPRAYDKAQAQEFFEKLDKDKWAARGQLAPLLKLMFFTGVRAGEALALRWRFVNVTDAPVKVTDPVAGEKVIPPRSLWVNGNIVRVTGKGLLRHSGKTFTSEGLVGLPPTLLAILISMRPASAREDDPLFPSTKGGWRDPSSFYESIRAFCRRAEIEGFTSHMGRKTFGTALDKSGHSAREVADGLRKASVTDTLDTYMGRDLVNPAAPAALEEFFRAADGASD